MSYGCSGNTVTASYTEAKYLQVGDTNRTVYDSLSGCIRLGSSVISWYIGPTAGGSTRGEDSGLYGGGSSGQSKSTEMLSQLLEAHGLWW